VRAGLSYAETGIWPAAPLGQVWADIDRQSLLLAQPAIERHVAAWLWDPVIFTLLQIQAWLFFGALGLVLLLISILPWLQRRIPRR
jgi:hypothetical protein